MKNKTKTIIIFSLIFSIFLISFVNAEMLTSNAGVQYDSRILDEFEKIKTNETINETFVKIIILLKDKSEADNLLSNFSKDELKDIINRQISDSIGVKVTEEGLYKLLQDERIEKVYFNIPISALQENKKISSLLIFILVLLSLLSLVLYLIIRKLKRKK